MLCLVQRVKVLVKAVFVFDMGRLLCVITQCWCFLSLFASDKEQQKEFPSDPAKVYVKKPHDPVRFVFAAVSAGPRPGVFLRRSGFAGGRFSSVESSVFFRFHGDS